MNFDTCHEKIKAGFETINPKFDDLTISLTEQHLHAIRISNSTVNRENIARETLQISIHGARNNRHSGLSLDPNGIDTLEEKAETLLSELERYPEDKEYVKPARPEGSFTFKPQDHIQPNDRDMALVYKLIEIQLKKARNAGLRATGFIEITDQKSQIYSSGHNQRHLQSLGITISFTVDHPSSSATGVGKASCLNYTEDEFSTALNQAMDHAIRVCHREQHLDSVEPGDYAVVLSPYALHDILNTTLIYGFFNKRTIDEGRSYLSGKLDQLEFPKHLTLGQYRDLKFGEHHYRDYPFNSYGVECDDIEYIKAGRIKDLNTSAYWAKETGSKWTFSPWDGPPLQLHYDNHHYEHKTTEDLIRSTKKGIYIVDTWYLRMVSEMQGVITGMTRDGLFLIENGRISKPIKHMRWHENPVNLLQNISSLTQDWILQGKPRTAGWDRKIFGAIPAAKVDCFHFSSGTRF